MLAVILGFDQCALDPLTVHAREYLLLFRQLGFAIVGSPLALLLFVVALVRTLNHASARALTHHVRHRRVESPFIVRGRCADALGAEHLDNTHHVHVGLALNLPRRSERQVGVHLLRLLPRPDDHARRAV